MLNEIYYFTIKQAKSCIFPASIFATLLLSNLYIPGFIHRYDFILLVLVLIQLAFILLKQETKKELLVIFSFHLFGLLFEIFKVSRGGWSYPEDAVFKVLNVPIYSGFMYASVATYVIHAWKNLNLEVIHWPKSSYVVLLSAIVYLNFFTNEFIYDFRWLIILLIIITFHSTSFKFQPNKNIYKMSASVSFLLISIFIWFAENLSTLLKAWQYPHQGDGWGIVDFKIISSWFLLVIFVVTLTIELSNLHSKKPRKSASKI